MSTPRLPNSAKHIGRSVAYTAEKPAVAGVADIDSPSSRAVAPLHYVIGTGAKYPAPSEHLPIAVAMAAIVLEYA